MVPYKNLSYREKFKQTNKKLLNNTAITLGKRKPKLEAWVLQFLIQEFTLSVIFYSNCDDQGLNMGRRITLSS